LAGAACYAAVSLKPRLRYDDSLDAFGVHGVGGFLGAVLTGVFCSAVLYRAGSGSDLPVAGGPRVVVQFVAAAVAAVYAFGVTLLLAKVVDSTCGFCADAEEESEGLDRSQHGEVGFDLGPALELAPERTPQAPRPATAPPNGQKRFTVVVEG